MRATRAEDLVQSALVKTFLAWPRLRDPGAVESYTRRVLVTTAISWWRRRPYLERPLDATGYRYAACDPTGGCAPIAMPDGLASPVPVAHLG